MGCAKGHLLLHCQLRGTHAHSVISAHYDIRQPDAHIIRDDAEAISVAHRVAALLREGASDRDRRREVPVEVVDAFSNSGLWGITVPREYGGVEVSFSTLAQVIAIVSAADPLARSDPAESLLFVRRHSPTRY